MLLANKLVKTLALRGLLEGALQGANLWCALLKHQVRSTRPYPASCPLVLGESSLVGLWIDDTTNSRTHLCMKSTGM